MFQILELMKLKEVKMETLAYQQSNSEEASRIVQKFSNCDR